MEWINWQKLVGFNFWLGGTRIPKDGVPAGLLCRAWS